jgi:phage gpG-like protein
MPVRGRVISAEILGLKRVEHILHGFTDAAKDLRPFWRDVFAPKYFGAVQDMFATEGRTRGAGGRFVGGAWEPLSPRYKAWKDKHFPGRTILTLRGPLRESVRWGNGRLGAGGIFEPRPSYVIFGTSIPYAAAHQHGTDTMPARPFLAPPNPSVFGPLLRDWIKRNAAERAK